jgi:hypothetical protein
MKLSSLRGVFFLSALMTMAPSAAAQVPPADARPSTARVTDPARPDYDFPPWAGGDVTVVVVLAADCKACADDVPFYKRLTELSVVDGKAARVVFLTQGGIWPVVDMVEKHPGGFKMRRTMSYPDDDRFQVTAMPTVLVIDGKWKRRGTWVGPATAADHAEIVALVNQIVAAARKGNGR